MGLLKKNDKRPKEIDYDRHGHLYYDVYVVNNSVTINQYVDYSVDQETDSIGLMRVEGIPLEKVKDAIIDHMLEGSGLRPSECELKVVPKGDTSSGFDTVGLAEYREQIEKLEKAKRGLADVRQAFGWNTDMARDAEKKVRELERDVYDTFHRLVEGRIPESEAKE